MCIMHRGAKALFTASLRAQRALKNIINKVCSKSDYERWANTSNLEAWWDSRTKKISCFIPKGSRVVEFGAGRRQLEKYLDSNCSYIPCDLVDRGPGTIIFDLNKRPLPDLRYLNADVAIFSGVLEYIKDLPSVIEWLNGQLSCCVASYAYVHSKRMTFEGLLEMLGRAYYGYMNNYTEEELVAMFNKNGFVAIKKDQWDSQSLFLFTQQRQTSMNGRASDEVLQERGPLSRD